MKSVYIIYHKFYDVEKREITIGGIQTYLLNLCKVILECGCKPCLYQIAEREFVQEYNGIEIHGLNVKVNLLSKKVLKLIGDNQVVIFASEFLIRKYKGESIAIQHGISWDKPSHSGSGNVTKELLFWNKSLAARKRIRQMSKAKQIICVDYNFINWYRALSAYQDVKLVAIPNFTEIPEKTCKNDSIIKIIFARRLFEYRGTRIFTKAISRILEEYDNISVTVAGDGPDEMWMKERLAQFDNVEFIKYDSGESLKIHRDKHIAVVPTIGSEGTSLSLLEAMASYCAVICTNVGGMTNIVLDRYNGLMVSPTENELYDSLKLLLDNAELRKQIADNAYLTAKTSFSIELWKERWKKVLEL